MQTVDVVSPEERFVAHLVSLADKDRGALAALRRGLGRAPGEVAQMHPHVVPWMPGKIGADGERAYYLVASLFALHPVNWRGAAERKSFGASLEMYARQTEAASTETRVIALLNSPSEDLPDRLRHAVSLLKSKDIPVDWARLLKDLRYWESEERWVQRAWAKDFWSSRPAEAPTEETTEELEGAQE